LLLRALTTPYHYQHSLRPLMQQFRNRRLRIARSSQTVFRRHQSRPHHQHDHSVRLVQQVLTCRCSASAAIFPSTLEGLARDEDVGRCRRLRRHLMRSLLLAAPVCHQRLPGARDLAPRLINMQNVLRKTPHYFRVRRKKARPLGNLTGTSARGPDVTRASIIALNGNAMRRLCIIYPTNGSAAPTKRPV
jgi:hypothetical protein